MKINHFFLAGLFSVALFSSVYATEVHSTSSSQVVPPKAQNQQVATTTSPNQTSFSEAQVKQLQQIIHDYLVKNPQVLVEASQAYQDQELAKEKTQTQQAVAKNQATLFNSSTSPTVGNLNGDVSVIEFLDYQCAHCREMSTIVDNLIKSDNKLRIVIKQLPIFGGSSKFAAQASIAAIKQGPDKFLVFHRTLLEASPPLSNDKVLDLAKKAGLNITQLQNDIKNKAVDSQIDENFKLAQNLGLKGTPTFFIGNRTGTYVEYIPGAVTIDNLKQSINKARGGSPKQ